MKLKKILAAVLLAAMLLTLAACDNSEKKPAGSNGGNEEVAEWAEFKTANTEEVVLTAQNGCTITVAPVTYANNYAEFRVTFQNKTEVMKSLELACFAINGVIFNGYLNLDVEAGATDFEIIGASVDSLRMRGIFQIATVDLMFNVADDTWTVEETLSCQLKTDAADSYVSAPNAYFKAITNEDAQSEIGYTVKDSLDERIDLGDNVYLESKVYLANEEGEELLLEVVNENTEMRFVRIYADTVNGMAADGAGENYTVLPGAKAIISVDLEWALPLMLREAFGVQQIADVQMFSEVYACEPDGSMDWTDDGEYNNISYVIPDVNADPDMSGLVIYDESGLRITAKAPVKQVIKDEEGEITQNYVYLIFENVGEADFQIQENEEKQVVIGDGQEEKYYYFNNPYYLYAGDQTISYVEVDDMEDGYVFLPLLVLDISGGTGRWEVDMNLQF